MEKGTCRSEDPLAGVSVVNDLGEVSGPIVTSQGDDSPTCVVEHIFENWRKLGNHQGGLVPFQKQIIAQVLHFMTNAGSRLPLTIEIIAHQQQPGTSHTCIDQVWAFVIICDSLHIAIWSLPPFKTCS